MIRNIRILFAKVQGAFQRGTVATLCIVLIGFFIAAGCEEPTALHSSQSDNSALQTDDKDKKICDFDNPLTDLVWLKQIVDNIEIDSENGKVHARIYQCIYKYGTGFLIEPCVGCPDAGYSFRSCDGTILCGGGGISGEDTCQELDIDFDTKQLIYQHN
jgi:hypothetical protein